MIASVTTSIEGVVIHDSATADPPPAGSGFTFLGHQLNISAPAAGALTPLQIAFAIDASLLHAPNPDLTAATVAIFRNGYPVADCTAPTTDDPATPNPCVSARETLSAVTTRETPGSPSSRVPRAAGTSGRSPQRRSRPRRRAWRPFAATSVRR